ncbi:MAG TPA: hypothetical protein VH590_15845 [Ktedonobacterales bacterium]|jgi:hypothetical protein
MTSAEILEELRKLPASERLSILEAALHLTREEMQQGAQTPRWTEEQQHLALAAKALLPDYTAGGELTEFTVLDSEDFYG